MKELIFLVLMALLLFSFHGSLSSRDKKLEEAIELMKEVRRFLVYVEEHKFSLPPDIRERFDELERFCKQRKET